MSVAYSPSQNPNPNRGPPQIPQGQQQQQR